jgi:3D (Asp-Asp-Asp) domain-containing protein
MNRITHETKTPSFMDREIMPRLWLLALFAFLISVIIGWGWSVYKLRAAVRVATEKEFDYRIRLTQFPKLSGLVPVENCGKDETFGVVDTRTGKVEQIYTLISGATIYSYNSEVGQTDNSPRVTASGKEVYDGLIANNCLPFGTKIEWNGKIYTVDDRMNKRYNCKNFDIWKESKQESLDFGVKYNQTIKVL